MKKLFNFKINKLIINNKIKYGDYNISISVENYFTKEMKELLEFVNQDIEMDFNCSHFNNILNKKFHLVTRVDNEIVAYHQLIDSQYCVLKEVLKYININNNNNNNKWSIQNSNIDNHIPKVLFYNFSCVSPKYRYGNLFYYLNYLIAYKFAIENQYQYIGQLIGLDSPSRLSIEKIGFKLIIKNVFKIQDQWNSYFTNIDTLFYLSDNLKFNSIEKLNLINILINLIFQNDKNNFFKLLNNFNINNNNNKSKL